jgi:pSer/pThr/pTyr-binding forkhead associated (FHA) protein
VSKHHETRHRKGARLRVMLPTGDTYKRKVTGSESHIGSGLHNEIPIIDPEISTTQATLALNGNTYYIVDEGGGGGTFVNGERVTGPRKLSHGDVIKMGKSRITFTLKHGVKAHKDRHVKSASSDAPVKAEAPSKNGHSEAKDKKHKARADERNGSASEAKAPLNGGGADAGQKKKKDKQKEKEKVDERVRAARVRAWGGIIATVLSVVLTVTISILVTRMGGTQTGAAGVYGSTQGSKKLAGLSSSSKISGGKFEASGAVAVPDANGILFVDDSKPDQVFYMPVNELGEQDGPVKAIPLGVSVINPEGISQFGSRFMIVGSLSTQESNDGGGIATFDFDPATMTVYKTVVLTGMRKFLFDNVPELKAWANKTGIEGGLNVEGIAVDPNPEHPRVLLGLRGPVLNGNALVVPIKLLDRQAPLAIENLALDEPNAIELNLNGQAIRDIQYDSRLRSFLIISGAPELEEKTNFTLWEWNGDGNQARDGARPKEQALLDKKMKPEGVTHLKISNQEFVFIVGDASQYTKIEYISQ